MYLSPADLYQLRTNPKNPSGYYGNGSSNGNGNGHGAERRDYELHDGETVSRSMSEAEAQFGSMIKP